MANQDPTSTAASDALSSRERDPPSAKSRPKSKRRSVSEPRAVATGSKKAAKDARAKSKRGARSPNTATRDQKTENQPQETNVSPNGYPVHSTSKLAELFDLNRATIAQRLKEHKIKPVEIGPRKADYELTPQVEEILSSSYTDPELKDAQRRTAIANARIKEKEADEAERRSIPRDEMFEEVSGILKSLYQALVLQMPRANRARYAKITNPAEMEKALKADNTKPFLQLRNNYNEIFNQRSEAGGQRSAAKRGGKK